MKLSASVLVFFTFIAVFASGKAAAYSGKDLFQLVSMPQKVSTAERSSIASVREADVAFDVGSTAMLLSAKRISIPLFDGKTFAAERNSVETRGVDDLTWRGKIVVGKFDGDVVLTFKKGYVAGLIYSPNSVYEIVPKGERQILIELDQRLFPPCAGGITDDSPNVVRPAASALVATDSGDRIDVLVVYTASVGTSLGGSAQAQAFAQQAVDAANTAYINSHIRQRLRLVGAQQTAMTETGSLGTELPVLRTDAATATLRDSLKADLVDMLSNSTDNCGIGYLMGSQPGNSTLGFTVTSRTCAVGNLSFAHELGHNMGSQHNPENGSGATYPYGYGHYVNGVFRTVMSYVDPCPSGCTRVAYFSNPYVNFNGLPTGIENARDNVRSINNTADAIANYRYSGSSITLANFDAGDLIPRLITHDLLWTSDNLTGNVRIDLSLDEGITWKAIVPSTPNDGTEPISVGVRVTRRARLRVVSLNNGSVSDSSVGNFAIR